MIHSKFLISTVTIETIQKVLMHELPGAAAHALMTPEPHYVKGVEGIHHHSPVNSAVLLLLIPYREEWVIPFIQRTSVGKYHGGQIALPGGKVEPEDVNARSAALRECHEEIGVKPEDITIIGSLSDVYIPLSNFNITPFIGTIPKMPNFVLSKDEVEEVILIPLNDLFDDKNKTSHLLYRHDQQIVAPGYKIEDHFIWGATAMMIAELETLLKNEQ